MEEVEASLSKLLDSIGPFKTGLFLFLAFCGPSAVSWNWYPASSASFEFCWQLLFFAGLFLAGLLTASTNISGPLRYGKNTYGSQIITFIQKRPSWAIYSLLLFILFPMSRHWCLAAIPVAWHYTREHHHEAIRELSDKVDGAYSRAMAAAKLAQEDAAAAARYEHQAQDIASAAVRDARLADALRVTDFFDKSAEAWIALTKIKNAAHEAAEASQNTLSSVEELQDSGSLESQTDDLYQKAEIANTSAEEAEEATNAALARAADFKEAKQQADKYRDGERKNAQRAVSAAEQVANDVVIAAAAARTATEKAEQVRQFATSAKTAAIMGNMDEADARAHRAHQAETEAVDAAKKAELARDESRNHAKIVAGR
ncbi:hypothetical protein AOQ84DRAFT_442885 [Glonium stellatum]|uniref:Uncharacterized protein n=1 Tax=Glonium stellatum TaxID=574774 RepID=A0A8E2JN49_9PEZI|nr:hypothetical protein AOQ84DRAFT_442885 [Glonium stellatum]